MMTIDSSDAVGRPDGKLTKAVILICIVAASAGLMFGYDIGITGGVTTFEPFLEKFFPSVVKKMADAKQDKYCIFDSQILTLFTSSLYLSGLMSSLAAGPVTTTIGRQGTLLLSGVIFLVGAALNAFAIDVEMLIFGRLFLGFGVGFANQAAPVYLTEMAPPKWRGALNIGFQFFLAGGNLLATFINVIAAPFGVNSWRIALGGAAIPALIMTIGAIFIPDTPGSLIQRGKNEKARKSLVKVRGMDSDTETELNDLINSNNEVKNANQQPYKKLLQRRYRPHLTLLIVIPLCQQLTGVGMVAFYAPVLFRSMGSGQSVALMGALILGVVNTLSALVSAYVVDKLGRKFLFIEGGVQIMLSEVAIAGVLALQVGNAALSSSQATTILVLMCSISASFGWSWGPLTWLVPTEILPTDLRPVGQGLCLAINFLITFIQAQICMTLVCHLKYGLFLLYAGLTVLMTIFVALFVPETKGVRLEQMHEVWKQHWYWRRFVTELPK